MAYATVAEFKLAYDTRLLGDLVSDDGKRTLALANDGVISQFLDTASGLIDAACRMGGRYTTAQLAALGTNSDALLVDITCQIAMGRLLQRRNPADEKAVAVLEQAGAWLERLRLGEHIFDIDEVIDAANISGNSGPTTVELSDLHLLRYETKHFYPSVPRTPNGR